MIAYYFDWAVIWRAWDKFAAALGLGLTLAVISLAIGTVIGLAVALGRVYGPKWLDWILWLYVEVIRNLPLLLLVFFVYFGLPELDINQLDKYQSFVLALSLYAGAYMAEVFRAGLLAVPVRYMEAAKAIGLRPWQRQAYVVLPVMFRITLPAVSNNLISLFKDTSLAAAIAIPELTFVARQINANTFRVMESWLTATALYLITCYSIAWALRLVEKRYASIR